MARFLIVIEKARANYAAYSPDIPGCIATGKSIDATLANIHEAIQFHFAGLREDGLPIPEPQSEAVYVFVPNTAKGSNIIAPNEMDETVFPLKKAYAFAAAHGLAKEAEEIRSMQINWSRGSSVRRWHMIQLFKSRHLLKQFYQEHWSSGTTDRGEQEETRCLRAKRLWEERSKRLVSKDEEYASRG